MFLLFSQSGRAVGALLVVMVAAGSPARADLHFPEPVVDVGEGHCGVPLSHRFAFVNRGPTLVEIIDFRAGCGCLTPRLLKRVYQPGETGTLQLEINTLSQEEGAHSWTCQVVCQGGGRRWEAPLQMKGRIVAEVTVRPAVLTVFTETAGSHEIVVTDRRPQPLRVVEVRATSARLTPRISEETKNEQGHTIRRIRLEVAADCAEGRHEETLAIFTSDALYRELRVPVTVVKRDRPRVTAAPAEVTLPPGAPTVSTCLIRLRDRQDQKVVIETITADDPAVTCTWAPGPEAQATIRVRIDSPSLTARHTLVRVQLGQPTRETLLVPVTLSRP